MERADIYERTAAIAGPAGLNAARRAMSEITLHELADVVVMAEGLQLPEGPVALADGSVIVVELRGGRLSRVLPSGEVETVADLAGAPNGAARGPDGAPRPAAGGHCLPRVAAAG